MELTTSLREIPGIGFGIYQRLKKLNLETVEDLINHFPFRYDDFSHTVSSLEANIGENITLQGEIWSIKNIFTRFKKVITQAIFNDSSSSITLTWFNQSWLTKQIKSGDKLQISGKLSKYKNKLSIMMPVWEKLADSTIKTIEPIHTGRLVPIYPETFGLTSKWIRAKIAQILPQVIDKVSDPLPDQIRGEMLPLNSALSKIHFPENQNDLIKASERIGFDEMFFVSLATQKARGEWRNKPSIKALKIDQKKVLRFIGSFPFKLTAAQIRVYQEITSDLAQTQPMNRLVQGEVGSGKTIIAAIALYISHLNKYKSLYMAPTEILAFQHFETITKLMDPFGIKVGIYTGSKKNAKDADIIIGTHALLSQKLVTENVGLIIVDEQQRFGVQQRTVLRNRAKLPHFLTMTATPIPRTVALTLYGDLDLSVIDQMPKGRKFVKTFVVPAKKRTDAYRFVAKKIKKGDQVYIITPLIELSESITSAKAAKVEFERLKKDIFPEFRLGLLHGRLKSKDKEIVINEFKDGLIDLLVSTSVVEVGVDVANATIMVIEGAERFGLSQLHQLRGRVGRGEKESFCLLFPSLEENQVISRLKLLEKTNNGLELSEMDLKIRGAGEIFGAKQSGRFEFKVAQFSDLTLIEKTRDAAKEILLRDPKLENYPQLKVKLARLTKEVMPD